MTDAKSNTELLQNVGALELQIKTYTRIAWIFVAIGSAPFIYGIYALFGANAKAIDVVGQFLGGVTSSVWSLAGLVIIYVAFLGQKQQLILQQEELVATRTELKGQKEQLEAQNRTFTKQGFESTFFQMLSLHHEITTAVAYGDAIGLLAFEPYKNRFMTSHYQPVRQKNPSLPEAQLVQQAYDSFYDTVQAALGHYFRSLYNIVKFIDRSGLPNNEQRFYSNLVRAQLSTWELVLLFYNGMSTHGKKFKPLIEKYNLLKHLDDKLLLRPEHSHFGYEHTARRANT